MVNKPRPDGPAKCGNDNKTYNQLKLFNYFIAQSVGNLVKNIVITEVGYPVNNDINRFAHSTVDVHLQPLCRP
jgi:exo-beta-1,3-glucanase (GH17 family)